MRIHISRPESFICDKRKWEVTLVEVGITCQDKLHTNIVQKKRKYDITSLMGSDLFINITSVVAFVMRLTEKELGFIENVLFLNSATCWVFFNSASSA